MMYNSLDSVPEEEKRRGGEEVKDLRDLSPFLLFPSSPFPVGEGAHGGGGD